ncbi:MAG TPA: tetratricopeptide repeat protein [Caulifigura sp.]|jgi:tetratricopeptide (TPR) repeat protein|nr:tetratricopeptide repeat protein [Caulifigura sp.]
MTTLETARQPRDPRTLVLAALIPAILALIAYLPVRSCDFVNFDDGIYLIERERMKEGVTVDNLAWGLTTFEFANWHPMMWWSLLLDSSLYGISATGFHITNLVLHVLNAGLFSYVLMRMTGVIWPAVAAASIFAVHPLHVESVAWISERKDVLSTLFLMLTLLAYVRYVERPTRKRWIAVVAGLALGLMSKAMLVTAPCVLLLLDFWPLGRVTFSARSLLRLVREKWPLFALAAVSSVLTFYAQRSWGTMADLEIHPPLHRIIAAVVAYATYLRQYVWPVNLACYYPLTTTPAGPTTIAISACVLVAISLAVAMLGWRRKFLVTGWLWYLGTLVPVIGLIQVGNQAHADRYTYVPMMGISIAVCWLVFDLTAGKRAARLLASVVLAAAVAVWIPLTWQQISVWRNATDLWQHCLKAAGPSDTAYAGLAEAYRNDEHYDEAAEMFRRAVELNPKLQRNQVQEGWCLLLGGRIAEADDVFSKLLKHDPPTVEEHFQMGMFLIGSEKPGLAVAHFTRVLRHQPENGRAHLHLAVEMMKSEYYKAARRHFELAVKYDPSVLDVPGVRESIEAVKDVR